MVLTPLLYRSLLAVLEVAGNAASDISANFWVDSFGPTFSGNFTILVLSNVWSILVTLFGLIVLVMSVRCSVVKLLRKGDESKTDQATSQQKQSLLNAESIEEAEAPETLHESVEVQSSAAAAASFDTRRQSSPLLQSLFRSRTNLISLSAVALADFSINLFGTYAAGHVPVVDQVIMKSMEPLLCFLLYTAVWRAEDTKLILRALSEGRAQLGWTSSKRNPLVVQSQRMATQAVQRNEEEEQEKEVTLMMAPFEGSSDTIDEIVDDVAAGQRQAITVVSYLEPVQRLYSVFLSLCVGGTGEQQLQPEQSTASVNNSSRLMNHKQQQANRAFQHTWIILFIGPFLSLLVAALGIVAAMWSTLQKEKEEQSQNSTAYERKYSYIVFWLTMYGLRVVGSAVYNVAQGAFMKQNYESFVLLQPTPNNDDVTVRDPTLQQLTPVVQQQRSSSSLWLRSLTDRQRHILLSLICLLVDFLVNFILLMAVGPLLDTISFAGWGDSDSESDSWDNLRGGMQCVFNGGGSRSNSTMSSGSNSNVLPSSCSNCIWYALITNLSWVVVYMADSFLNEMSPALNSIVNMLTGPVTVFVLLMFPALNVQGEQKHTTEQVELQVAAAVCVTVSLGLFVWFDWFVEKLRQSYRLNPK